MKFAKRYFLVALKRECIARKSVEQKQIKLSKMKKVSYVGIVKMRAENAVGARRLFRLKGGMLHLR